MLSKRRQLRSGGELSRVARIVERLEDRTLLAAFVVDITADENDGNTAAGDVSLREAILAANANSGPDSITFAVNGVFQLSVTGVGEDAGATGDLDVTDDLTINGTGSANTIIDARGIDRVFHLMGRRPTQLQTETLINVTIAGVTIQGGVAAQGGGILSDFARLTIDSSRIENNLALGPSGQQFGAAGQGGGIFVGAGGGLIGTGGGPFGFAVGGPGPVGDRLTVIGTTFTNNQARGGDASGFSYPIGGDGQGGAIFNSLGFVEILAASPVLRSEFQNNRASGGRVQHTLDEVGNELGQSGEGEGGAIFNQFGHVEISDAYFNQNQAVGGGLLPPQSPTSPIPLGSGNGGGYGGAIYTLGGGQFDATLIVESSDFDVNFAVGAGTGHGQGGAIWSDNDTVSIDTGRFLSNEAKGGVDRGNGLGGAIYLNSRVSMQSEIRNATLTGNKALGGTGGHAEGGAIWSSGFTLALVRDELSGNRAVGGSGVIGGHGFGGGLYVRQDQPTSPSSTIRSSTFAENVAAGGASDVIGGAAHGGGIFNGENSSANISNSTFSANEANGGAGNPLNGNAFGGGLYHVGTTVEVINATITLNRANAGGAFGQGGGIAIGVGGGQVSVGNAVIAQNIVVSGFAPASPDVQGIFFLSKGGNFVGVVDAGATGFTDPTNSTDQVGTTLTPGNALLGALAFNLPSGPNGLLTRTHLPQAGSPLIDLGLNSLVLPNPDGFGLVPAILPPADQRDFLRSVDGDGADTDGDTISNAEVDIGATEFNSTPLPFLEADTDDEAVFQIVYDPDDYDPDDTGPLSGINGPRPPVTTTLVGRLTFLTRFDGPIEGVANDSDGDHLDDVDTFLASTSFVRSKTTSPNDEVFEVQQSLTMTSGGTIEETTDATPDPDTTNGRLDLPPFAAAGTAVSEVNLFVVVLVKQASDVDLPLHNTVPLLLRSTIGFKPAAPGDTFSLVGGPISLLNGGQRFATISSVIYTPLPLFDFGDAPETRTVEPTSLGGYPTTESRNGARHAVLDGGNGLKLGATVDPESNGNPTVNADGDDTTPVAPAPDDEDGVVFIAPLTAGGLPILTANSLGTVSVTASGTGWLNGWIDFNGDGDWIDTGEQIIDDQFVSTPSFSTLISIPANALGLEKTYSRFRISSVKDLSYDGFAPDGEVEDYAVSIQAPPRDFGDAPNPYPTGTSGVGAAAFHTIVTGLHLGEAIDAESTGQPNAAANGDGADEDGVAGLATPLIAGQSAAVVVTASQAGVLNAWLDFNGDGDWSDGGEQIFVNKALLAGVNNQINNDLSFSVPVGIDLASVTYARFRFNSAGDLSSEGGALDGEVEDYRVEIRSLDFGDAPIGYGTLLIDNGPRHIRGGPTIRRMFDVGSDAELDGQPNVGATTGVVDATGDDATGLRDEIGVFFTSPSISGPAAGFNSTLDVHASAPGYLNAWFDFNLDGNFADLVTGIDDLNERIFDNQPVVAGRNVLSYNVPAAVPFLLGQSSALTFVRFRITSQPGTVPNPITPYGEAPDGEVEDYGIYLEKANDPCTTGLNGEFVFCPTAVGNQTNRRFYDPAIAIGYDFEITGGGANFKSLTPPTLAAGDNRYTLHLDDGAGGYLTAAAATLDGGIEYDASLGFVDALGSVFAATPAGLPRFRILGIETAALVDPANPVAFAIGLSFIAGGSSFTMTGIPQQVYVDNVASPVIASGMAGDYLVTTDQGTIGMLDNGDTVTWDGGGATGDVTGLIFGATAFSSIQTAINLVESNGWSALTQITISNGTFFENLTISGAGAYLQGSGAGSTFLDGSGTGRVIDVTATATATLYRMTIQNGNSGVGTTGGGVRNAGTLTIDTSLIRNNSSGALNVAAGGGVFNSGILSITNSTIAGNTAYDGHGAGLANANTATITNSTISGNQSGMNGGGVFNSAGCVLTIQNSTISGNIADVNGDTIGDGGGIFALGTETLTSTIVAGNGRVFVDTPSDIVGGTINTASRNLIGDAGTAGGIVHGTGGNIVGNAGTGTLAIATILNTTLTDNGGPTPTHALAATSPAIDAGSNPAALASDQRGSESARTTDHTGVANAAGSDGTDIGAFEISPLTVSLFDAGSDFSIRLNNTSGQIEIINNTAGGTIQAHTPFGGTFGLIINGGLGDDLLTIDFSNGNPIPAGGITFTAGGQATPAGDSLTITGGAGFSTVTYNTAPGGAGTLTLNGSTINFTGLEPVTIVPAVGTMTITIDDANGTAGETLTTQITDGGVVDDGLLFLDAPGSAEDMTFTMPTTALIINGDNDDNDAISIVSLDTGFGATITIDGRGGNDTLTGGSRAETLIGGTGSDAITGNGGNDSLDGGANNDTYNFANGWGVDTLVEAAASGSDTISFAGASANLNWALGSITVTDGAGNSLTYAGNDVENLVGSGGNDAFAFSNGAQLAGGAGTIDGGSGTNTLDYSAYNSAVSANLGTGADLTATLNGTQEVGPTASAATGSATVSYNLSAQTFNLDLFVQGIVRTNINGFHLHQAAPGVNGSVIVDLLALGSFADVTGGIRYTVNNIPLSAVQQDNLVNGLTYFNIHTAAFGTGEIRGQVLLQSYTGTATGTTGIRNIQNVIGGSVGDTLTGSPANNSLTGGGGGDVLTDSTGNDSLFGEAGDDTLTDTVGTNQLVGGLGCDTINTQAQVDAIIDSPPATLEETAFSFDSRSNDFGTGLTITGVTQGTKGGVTFNGTSVTYTPNGNANGSDSFTYTITDFETCTDTATVNVAITAVNDAPVLDNTGTPYVIAPAGTHLSTEMSHGILITDLLARGTGGNPVTDADSGAVEGIALTGINKIDGTFGTWEFTLDANPLTAVWTSVETGGALSDSSALLLPADTSARLRFVTTLLPRHNTQTSGGSPATPAQGFLPLETKIDTGLTFRAWDRSTGTVGTRADTATNGGSTAFSTATETAGTYFETRLFRSFNTVAQLNTYTLEQEFNALISVFGYQDRSTAAFSGFTILMSPIPGVTTAPLYRMYFGIAFDSPSAGIQTDMGYRYLTTDLNEAIALEGFAPAAHQAERDGSYFRELGVNGGSGITGYIYTTAQPGTIEMSQIYRTDLFAKDTRTGLPGTPATGTVQQQHGDHVYTTNSAFEMTQTPGQSHIEGVRTGWRQEISRGFVRELSPNAGGGQQPARRAAVRSSTAETSLSLLGSTSGLSMIDDEGSLDRLASQIASSDSLFTRDGDGLNANESVSAGQVSVRSSRTRRDSSRVQTSNVEPIQNPTPLDSDHALATDTVFARWQELVGSMP
jgi:CSLREA domain-containing protein